MKRFACDACGKDIDASIEVGLYVRRDYCEDCAPKVIMIEEELLGLAEVNSRKLDERAKELHLEFAKAFPDGMLPDQPNSFVKDLLMEETVHDDG